MIGDNEKWAKKKCSEEVRLALKAIGEAAWRTETQTKIPLKVNKEDVGGVLLADLVTKKLKNYGFRVYRCECNTNLEYFVAWGDNSPKIPDGFNLV